MVKLWRIFEERHNKYGHLLAYICFLCCEIHNRLSGLLGFQAGI